MKKKKWSVDDNVQMNEWVYPQWYKNTVTRLMKGGKIDYSIPVRIVVCAWVVKKLNLKWHYKIFVYLLIVIFYWCCTVSVEVKKKSDRGWRRTENSVSGGH